MGHEYYLAAMKILHLFSNWKWTGPAEPALNLCHVLGGKHETAFVSSGHPFPAETTVVGEHALERGVAHLGGFRLNKHFHPLHNLLDVMKLKKVLKEKSFDIVHAHLTNDHLIASAAVRAVRPKPLLVRSSYEWDDPARTYRDRRLFSRSTDGVIVISRHARDRVRDRGLLSPEKVTVIPTGVDTARFDPSTMDRNAARRALGFGAEEFVFGIVARMQRHRKFGLLLRAFKRTLEHDRRVRLVIVGRGTHQEEVARLPAAEMGLGDRVVFPGYLAGRSFVEALAAMDCGLFLVPGSDGSCRAVREKMAMALPVIAFQRPPLDEIIDGGKTGFLVEEDEERLFSAMAHAAKERSETAAMGERAREKTLAEYSIEVQAERVGEFYQGLFERRTAS